VTSFEPLVTATNSFITLYERAISNTLLLEGFTKEDTFRLSSIATALRNYKDLAAKIPSNLINYDVFRFVLAEVTTQVSALRPGDSCIIPMGWFKSNSSFYDENTSLTTTEKQFQRYQRAENEAKKGKTGSNEKLAKFELLHHMNIVITHHATIQGVCTVAFVNLGAGQGLEYHPCIFSGQASSPLLNPNTTTNSPQNGQNDTELGMNVPTIQYQPVFVVEQVPLID